MNPRGCTRDQNVLMTLVLVEAITSGKYMVEEFFFLFLFFFLIFF